MSCMPLAREHTIEHLSLIRIHTNISENWDKLPDSAGRYLANIVEWGRSGSTSPDVSRILIWCGHCQMPRVSFLVFFKPNLPFKFYFFSKKRTGRLCFKSYVLAFSLPSCQCWLLPLQSMVCHGVKPGSWSLLGIRIPQMVSLSSAAFW